MRKKNLWYRRATVVAAFAILITPAISMSSEIDHDWYCPEPEAHEQYMQHHKKYHSKDSSALVQKLTKIYEDMSLDVEQKQTKAREVMDKYLSHLELGQGD